MRGTSARGGGMVVKSPYASLSPSSGPMNKPVTQGGDRDRQTEKQQNTKGRQMETKEKKEKKDQNKTTLEISTLSESRIEHKLELDLGARKEENSPIANKNRHGSNVCGPGKLFKNKNGNNP